VKLKLPINISLRLRKIIAASGLSLIILLFLGSITYAYQAYNKMVNAQKNLSALQSQFEQISKEYEELKNQDQVKINQDLNAEIKKINETYKKAIAAYEDLLDLKIKAKNTTELDKLFASTLNQLSEKNYEDAIKTLATIDTKISEEQTKLVQAEAVEIAKTVPAPTVSNSPPSSGYSRLTVNTEAGAFTVDIVSADLASTRVIVDTASASDCRDNCPVLSLADYVARNGAFAGVNGSYFCPVDYPSCAGKTNTFDLLVMNKNKIYFNSDNNVYSNNPAVIFGSGYIRFVGAASQWGRDTSIDSMLSNYPLLVSGGNVIFGGDVDPKKGSKGNRSFVANRGNTVYIGVVRSATVAESARTMKALGMENALNLDNGGSTALWSGGYKVGPGRALPNVILFVRR
jgi:predicted RNA-binding protein associated with RNAse of E/G family